MHVLLIVIVYLFMTALIIEAKRLSEEKARISTSMLLYFIVFPFVSPFWIIKSIYNALFF